MIFHQVHDAVQRPVYGSAVILCAAIILRHGFLLIIGNMQSMTNKFFNAFVFGGGNRHHRDAQQRLHGVNIYGAPVSPKLVHHIQGQHHGHIQLQQLHGQVQIPFQIGGIGNVYDAAGLFLQNELPGDDLFCGIRRKRVDPRQIRDLRIRMAFDRTAFSVYGDAGKVPHMLVGACKLIKQGSLAAVLISCQSEGQPGPSGQGRSLGLIVKAAFLP